MRETPANLDPQAYLKFPNAPEETPVRRRIFELAALLLLIGFYFVHHSYWVPANGGVDQNGYLMGGKLIADHGSTRYDAMNPVTGKPDPFRFVGLMWIGVDMGTPAERWYPKYPIGLPALVALAFKIGGSEFGPVLTYYINPIAITLAMGATFLLVRLLAGSFSGLIAMIILMTAPGTMGHANNPNSHATTMFCVTAGMFLLLRWWQLGGFARAAGAGFLLGYAMTIRYTEGLLLLPLGLVILYKLFPAVAPFLGWASRWCVHQTSELSDAIRGRKELTCLPPGKFLRRAIRSEDGLNDPPRNWFRRRTWIECIVAAAAWALPVIVLIAHNLKAFHALTGYDPSNESSGFSWEFADDNWVTMLTQLNNIGVYLLFPIAIVGMVWMFRWSWRVATVFVGWIIPNIFIYTLYYWAPDGTNMGYMRFFVTIFPGLMACSFWLIHQLMPAPALKRAFNYGWGGAPAHNVPPLAARIVMPIVLGVIAIPAIAINLDQSLRNLEGEQRGNMTLFRAAQEAKGFANVPATVPPGSVIFGSDGILDHLQFAGDWIPYRSDVFSEGFVRRFAKSDPDEPQVFQPQRAKFFFDMLKSYTAQDFQKEQQRLILQLVDGGQHVYYFVPRNGLVSLRSQFAPTRLNNPDYFEFKVVSIWNDPNVNPRTKPPSSQPRRHKITPPPQDPKQTAWCIVEVKRKTEPVKPQPVTPEAPKPETASR